MSHIRKAFSTRLTGMWPHPCVGVHVGLEVVGLAKLPPTHVTAVTLLSRVHPDVSLQVPSGPEGHPAGGTRERLLPRVHPSVGLHVGLQNKLLSADVAGEGLGSRVPFQMVLVGELQEEAFLTRRALVRQLRRVESLIMAAQDVFGGEGFPAEAAGVLSGTRGVVVFVSPQVSQGTQTFQAHFAAEGFFMLAVNRPLVPQQLEIEGELLPTRVTHEVSGIAVNRHQVLSEGSGLSVDLPTLLTAVRLLSGVDHHVSGQVSRVGKTHPTGLALMWLFSCVDQPVLGKARLRSESLAAVRALKRSFVAVYPFVALQVERIPEALPTGAADVRPLTRVNGQVIVQVVFLGETLFTGGTGERFA